MLQSISNKFFNDTPHYDYPKIDSLLLTSPPSKNVLKLIYLSVSVSVCYLTILSNVHNQIMASNQSGVAKLIEVGTLGVASTITTTLLALIDLIIRFVPGIIALGIIHILDIELNENKFPLKETINLSIGMPFLGLMSGYRMLTDVSIFNVIKQVDALPKVF